MEHINAFAKGMNKDISKILVQPDTYLHAENLSLVTELGQSSGILRNIKGNELSIIIPDCSNVVKVTQAPATTSGTLVITLGLSITIDFTNPSWPSILAADINTNYSSAGFLAAYGSDYVLVYGGLSQANTLLQNNLALVGTGGTVVDNNYIPGSTSPKIMGWGTIRDSIILFTTNETSITPSSSYGQIWKLEYDKVFLTTTIKLLYHNLINFSLGNPIANPGRFVGNFETPAVQKIYWTDNYNPPRSLNIADTNCFAIEPRNLDTTPNKISGNGVIQEILQSGGNLPAGTYQVAYRLKKSTGARTAFSITDNPLPITSYNDVVDGLTLTQGSVIDSTNITSKQLRYTFYNLDTTFQNIEVALIYRQTATSSPDIKVLIDEPIPSSGQFTCTISGNEAVITPLTLDEFLREVLNFNTVKTIASKNNYIFYGNVKYSDFDVTFDARAYRFNSSGDTYETIDTAIPDTWGVAENADAINPNQDSNGISPYIYQQDGITVGGSGPRVSYRFVEPDITSDYKILLDNTIDANSLTSGQTYYNTARQTNTIDLGLDTEAYNDKPSVGAFYDFRSPYLQATLKGYFRDETYSFGIVFYSKKGEPSYVHWIGDIRVPHTHVQHSLTYPTTLRDGRNLYGFPMGIEFTVDVTGLEDLIDGYSIVRCERTDTDKSILGQGLMLNAVNGDTGVVYLLSDGMNINTSDYDIAPDIGSFYSPDFNFVNLPSFRNGDYLNFVGLLGANQAMTALDSNREFATQGAGGTISDSILYTKALKNYEFVGTSSPATAQEFDYDLDEIIGLDGATARGTNAAFRFNNSTTDVSPTSYENTSSGVNRSMNNKLLAFKAAPPFAEFSNANGDWARIDEVENGANDLSDSKYRAYLMNYKRLVTSQYGGNTYNARSLRQYISTGHIRRINNSSINTDMVFGGDTYICLYDTVTHFPNRFDYSFQAVLGNVSVDKALWNDITDAPGIVSTESWGYWQARVLPVETCVNVNWRRNPNTSVPNMDYLYGAYPATPSGYRLDVYEDFSLETGYFLENNLVKYFPRAIGLALNDKFDVRVFRSSPKINGELTDSWGIFQEEDYIDVDTAQGELNNLIVHQDRLVSFQDRGIAIIAVNDRALTEDSTGNQITLGTSTVLSRYDYISKEIGSRHQFGFTQSHDAVFFFDINTKNLYKLTGNSPLSLSVAKGMQSFTSNNLNGLLQVNDNPYLNKGLTATYDFKYNEALFTFKDSIAGREAKFLYRGRSGDNYFFEIRTGLPVWAVINTQVLVTYTDGFGVLRNEVGTITSTGGGIQITVNIPNSVINLLPPDVYTMSVAELVTYSFTLAYNDFIDAFTSFYGFTPSVYVNDRRNIFSPSANQNDLWVHDKGDYCRFYDTIHDSKLDLIVNPYPTETKVFDNYELTSESINPLNQNVPDDTITSIRVYNDYQNSDFRDITTVAKRKERTWNITNLRNRVLYTTNPTDIFTDLSTTDILFSERMRDKYLYVNMIYDNQDNNKLQLHTFRTYFRKSAR